MIFDISIKRLLLPYFLFCEIIQGFDRVVHLENVGVVGTLEDFRPADFMFMQLKET